MHHCQPPPTPNKQTLYYLGFWNVESAEKLIWYLHQVFEKSSTLARWVDHILNCAQDLQRGLKMIG